MGSRMRVFVAGGTGAIGGYAVPALIRAGHAVSALARSDAKAEVLRGQGAPPVQLSLFDRDALATVFENHDAVINLASALPPTMKFILRSAWRECDHVRIKGSAAVVDAAQAAGVPRLIQESVAMIYADGGQEWIDEDHPVEHYPIARGNHAAEAVVAALTCSGGTYNIVDDQPVTKRQYARACADAVGVTLWGTVPGRIGLLLGDRLTSLTRSLRVSKARFRDAAGWQPQYPSLVEGYHAMAHID
jgi:nucleoside-diphosphate-sugar epimerase